MPQRKSPAQATVTRLALFAVVGWALVALTRKHAGEEADVVAPVLPAVEPFGDPEPTRVDASRSRPRSRRQRIATSLAFTTLFFAGAAFSAGAGDMVVQALEPDCNAPAAELTAEEAQACDAEAAPADETATDEAATDEASSEDGTTEEPAVDEETDTGSETDSGEADDSTGVDDEDPSGDADEPTTDDDPADDGSEDDGAPAGDSEGDDGAGADSDHGSSGDAGEADHAGNGGGADEGEQGEAPAGPPLVNAAPEHEGTEELDPEAELAGTAATVWLHRDLGDPIPPARRLRPEFARMLASESRRADVDWALVLAAIRAEGGQTRSPASRSSVRATAAELAELLRDSREWDAFLALKGRTAFADRATALTSYNRAVGLHALVIGFEAAKAKLEKKVLSDDRLAIYAGGRADVQAHRIDVRVLVLMRYLAETYDQVTVSSLDSGHGLYARPGVVSAHKYGLAVDIAALGGRPVFGNSAPGGLTEQAVRDILLLPTELRPRQVISLLGLGGPSFPMANHADHIHVGF